jgi:pilus assembly protein CpaC
MLFRSTGYQRDETELVIVVTPYLVRPVSHQMATPADGYRAPSDAELNIGGQTFKGVTGSREPTAIPAPVQTAPVASPGFSL